MHLAICDLIFMTNKNLENELNAIIQMSLALINILRGQMDYAIDDKSKFIARHILSAAGSILNYC